MNLECRISMHFIIHLKLWNDKTYDFFYCKSKMSVLVKSAFFLLMLKSVITDHSSNFSSEVCTSPNEEFQSCGTACPLTCSNIKNPPELCTLQCVIGCGCRTGFVKDSQSGNCVSPENCSGSYLKLFHINWVLIDEKLTEAICGENEKYNLCGTACAITCANYKKPLLKCTLQCVPGCECQDGFIRDTQTGKCVLAENCTGQCPSGYFI